MRLESARGRCAKRLEPTDLFGVYSVRLRQLKDVAFGVFSIAHQHRKSFEAFEVTHRYTGIDEPLAKFPQSRRHRKDDLGVRLRIGSSRLIAIRFADQVQ